MFSYKIYKPWAHSPVRMVTVSDAKEAAPGMATRYQCSAASPWPGVPARCPSASHRLLPLQPLVQVTGKAQSHPEFSLCLHENILPHSVVVNLSL